MTKKLLLCLVTILVILTSMTCIFAAEKEYVTVKTTVTYNGKTLTNGDVLRDVKAGEKITVKASCSDPRAIDWSTNTNYLKDKGYTFNKEGMAFIGYLFDSTDSSKYIDDLKNPSSITITIPNFAAGSEHFVVINAVAACDGLMDNGKEIQATSGTLAYKFYMKDNDPEPVESITMTLKEGSGKATATAKPVNGEFSKFKYSWDGGAEIDLTKNPSEITYPTSVGKHTLKIYALTKNNKKSNECVLEITVKDPEVDGELKATVGNKELSDNKDKPTTVKDGDAISVTRTPVENFTEVKYKWDNGDWKPITSNTVIDRPFFDPDTTHTLTIYGKLKNGKEITKVYYIYIPKGTEPTMDGYVEVMYNGKRLTDGGVPIKVETSGIEVDLKGVPAENFSKIVYTITDGRSEETADPKGSKVKIPLENGVQRSLLVYGLLKDNSQTPTSEYKFLYEYDDEDDELDLEPWMIENSDAEGLLVSLRNSSEIEKSNYNFYMLDEEVIYYIDYLNAGKDIKEEVKLVFNVPLEFTVINAKGAVADTSKKTITWTFPDGLKEDQGGTKEVILKYTALSRKSMSSETIYPNAVIYQKTKAKDTSAVINVIYKDDDTELDASHSPYMIGDREKPTFRPDDGISRAEGALVLMRIFEVNFQNAKITDKFSDIDQTYEQAQKAISKATELGVIKGYTDGTYRPNEKMTRAEFMKIIASYVEILGEDENVKGLEIKDDNSIWFYKNPSSKNHWAIPYVTLLSRLNMTNVRKDKNLRLDDTITRAEVAQLCNYYLFRCPVKVLSGTKTDFTDVTRSHKLFADIVEATRKEHEVLVDEEGREIGK